MSRDEAISLLIGAGVMFAVRMLARVETWAEAWGRRRFRTEDAGEEEPSAHDAEYLPPPPPS